MAIDGSFGLEFRQTAAVSDPVFKFVGKDAVSSAKARAYHGTGAGSEWTEITHDGSHGILETDSGLLRLQADGGAVVLPSVSADPPGSAWSSWSTAGGSHRRCSPGL